MRIASTPPTRSRPRRLVTAALAIALALFALAAPELRPARRPTAPHSPR